MKKSLGLAFAMLLFVVLGCSLGDLGSKSDEAPTPVPDAEDAEKTETKTDSSGDSTSTSSTGKGSITLDSFSKMKNGMTYEEVVKILGKEGEETSSSTIGKYELKSYKWEGEKSARISASFRNNELRSKSQFGLGSSSGSGDADLTKAKYEQIKIGMTYDEVKEIIGSPGEQTSTSTFGNSTLTSYRWKGENFSNMYVRFKDDKVTGKSNSGLK